MALAKTKKLRTPTKTIEYNSEEEDEKKIDSEAEDGDSNTENEENDTESNAENDEDSNADDDEESNANEDEESNAENDEESDDENDEESDARNDKASEDGNVGWADSIAKVLSSTKPKTKKSVVLSRAKKIQPGKEPVKKEKPTYDFEVEGEIKEEKPAKEELKQNLKQRKNLQLPLRVRPTWKDIERERTLRKVATKGVVQLFNAVRIQQKDIEQQLENAGPLDSRKDAVLNNINKKKFLDVLMSGSRAKSEAVDNTVKREMKEEDSNDESDDNDVDDEDENASDSGRKRKSQWNVLRPDFMTNKKIKHWDEEDDDSNDNQSQSNEGSEDDDEE